MLSWIPLIGKLFDTGGDYVETKQKIKKIKAAGAIKLAQTKVNAAISRAKSDADSAGDLDKIALQNVGWKDEFLMLVITVPMILAFVPYMVPYVEAGFKALEQMPVYYQYAVGGVYVYVFGFKRILLKVMNAFIEARFGKPKTTIILEKKKAPRRELDINIHGEEEDY